MSELFLVLVLWLSPATVEVRSPPPERVALEPVPDPCAVGRAIAGRGACLRPEDCGAYEGWMRLFGGPRVEPLDPALARAPRAVQPRTWNCPAAPGR